MALKTRFEFQDLRLEAIPERRGGKGGSNYAQQCDEQVSGGAHRSEARVEGAEIDEDEDVDHVKAVADGAVKGQRSAAQRSQQTRAACGDGDEEDTGEEQSKSGIEESSSGGDGGRGQPTQNGRGDAEDEPSLAAPAEGEQRDGKQAAERDAIEVNERMRAGEPVGMEDAQRGREEEQRAEDQAEHQAARAKQPDQRRPEQVILLLDGERPGGAKRAGQRSVAQILKEERVGGEGAPVGLVGERVAEEPEWNGITDDEQQQIDGPDAQRAASVKVAEVVRAFARLQQDGGDEKSGENEEEVDAGPSPERDAVQRRADEQRMAVVEDDSEDGDAAQSLQLRQITRQPGGTLRRGRMCYRLCAGPGSDGDDARGVHGSLSRRRVLWRAGWRA